jgi:tetratricopeptide (TPR) repeat protein
MRLVTLFTTLLIGSARLVAAQAHAPAADDSAGLGRITFPTSATPAAHAAFERGVLYLHNFHYSQAIEAFRRARSADSSDVMSAAFEAIAFTHPVWDQQDTAKGRTALRSLAPTPEARLALARTPRERDWLLAAEALYGGDTPKAVRDTAFSRAMAKLHQDDPGDPEAASFYALSLLGLNQGDREPRAYAQAEAVADTVLASHPLHPGALHYKIHAVDDPASASRGLDAAHRYGEVAASAGHALHMTSHIYIALGQWDDVVAANRRAQATVTHTFGHGTHWLEYGLLQQGRIHEARAWVDSLLIFRREIAAGGPGSPGLSGANAYAVIMPATWVSEAEAWDDPLTRAVADTAEVDPEILAMADFLTGYAAARRAENPRAGKGRRTVDGRLADSMLARMQARREGTTGAEGPEATALGRAEVMEETLRAELAWGAGRRDSAVAMLRSAAARLEALPFAFGPPPTVKPPRERAGEMLVLLHRPAEAVAELDLAERTAPRRTAALRWRARALAALGRRAEAARAREELRAIWHSAEPDYPMLAEAGASGR